MLDNPLLNICIGLIFLFLLLSIITTALQEVVANIMSLRGKYLIKAIRAMIADGGTRADFFKHPLIYSLFRGKLKPTPSSEEPKRPPSYIPARNFAIAAYDVTVGTKPSVRGENAEEARRSATSLGSAVALAFALAAQQPEKPVTAAGVTASAQAIIAELEKLYNDTMDRATGWYRRCAQYISLVLGLLVATALNADAIHIGRQLWNNPGLSESAAKAAESFAQSNKGRLKSACATDSGPASAATDQGCEMTLAEVRRHLDQLASVHFPIGWVFTEDQRATSGEVASPERIEPEEGRQPASGQQAKAGWREWSWPARQPGQSVLSAIVGILLSAVAISLGSSFWFDTLNRCMSLRAAGKREDTQEAEKKT